MCACFSVIQLDLSHTPEPRHVLSRHSLPITDLHCGLMGAQARVATASLDQTVKVRMSFKTCVDATGLCSAIWLGVLCWSLLIMMFLLSCVFWAASCFPYLEMNSWDARLQMCPCPSRCGSCPLVSCYCPSCLMWRSWLLPWTPASISCSVEEVTETFSRCLFAAR